MPSWGAIAAEISAEKTQQDARAAGSTPYDFVRRKYLATATAHSGRATICYATRWTMPVVAGVPNGGVTIVPGDIQAFMEAIHGVKESKLDLIIHSPGGSPEGAEAIVKYLREKFSHLRIFVPHMAMSAATMIACAADEIVMGKHSFIGPIDPQLQLATAVGVRFVPAQAIIEQFARAAKDMNDPAKVRAWLPMLQQYGPDLLVTCERAMSLAQELVSKWLKTYMFAGSGDAQTRAESIAKWLSDHEAFKTHGRPISRGEAQAKGLRVIDLESMPEMQDAVLSVYHATTHTFAATPASKIVENHMGKAFIEMVAPPKVNPMQMLFGAQHPMGFPADLASAID